MTSLALLGRAFEYRPGVPLNMALATSHLDVGSRQLKRCQGMVENGFLPAFRCMASRTILAKLTLMDIVLPMAAGAICWGSLEYLLLMAIPAFNPYMPAGKRKSRL
jgi:hypothetical protein